MKIVKHFFHKKTLTSTVAILISTISLNSCHTTLYNAAERGDAITVKQELAKGANPYQAASKANAIWQVPAIMLAIPIDVAQIGLTLGTLGIYHKLASNKQGKLISCTEAVISFGQKTPAEIAYEKGHQDVLNELSKANVAIAPKSLEGKIIIIQPQKKCEDIYSTICNESGELFDSSIATINHCLKQFNQYNNNNWEYITNSQPKEFKWDISYKPPYPLKPYESYKQINRTTATLGEIHYAMNPEREEFNSEYYLLKFHAPTHGTYYKLHAMMYVVMEHETGHFWLKDAPTISAKADGKTSTKKHSTKRRRNR